jgi:hypothetical protein
MSAEHTRKLIRDLLPPIVSRFLLRAYLSARGHGWSIFRGSYSALAHVPATPGGQNNDWFVEDAAKTVESLRPEITRCPMGHEAGRLLLPLFVSQLLDQRGKMPTVLDFGGGAAEGLKAILEHVPNVDLARLRYILVKPRRCAGLFGALSPGCKGANSRASR